MYSKLKKVCTNVTEQDNNIINVLCKKQNKKKLKKKKTQIHKKKLQKHKNLKLKLLANNHNYICISSAWSGFCSQGVGF